MGADSCQNLVLQPDMSLAVGLWDSAGGCLSPWGTGEIRAPCLGSWKGISDLHGPDCCSQMLSILTQILVFVFFLKALVPAAS